MEAASRPGEERNSRRWDDRIAGAQRLRGVKVLAAKRECSSGGRALLAMQEVASSTLAIRFGKYRCEGGKRSRKP